MPIPARPIDTDADAERVQVELLRAASVSRRLGLSLSLTATVMGAARRALARAYPSATPRELRLLFVAAHYGSAAAAAVRDELERRDRGNAPAP